ncbi:thiamine phosphate synthase [Algoriphagus aquimarinus]|uniref:thiamine phosphate synthase n=1 Tax=Algoriphagus aquimarinus TaxID=237018 RepID=UPI0030DBBD70
MKLIVISSPDQVNDEAKIINKLFKSGLEYLHVRKPADTEEQVRKLIAGIDTDYYPRLSLHQHHCLAEEFGIKRLHYTENERGKLKNNTLEGLINNGFILSTSVHDLSLLASLNEYHYVFFGPVYNSISKQGYKSVLPPEFKLSTMKALPLVIGIGGIEAKNIDRIKTMNFDGAAILGSIWKNTEQAVENFKIIQECIKIIHT